MQSVIFIHVNKTGGSSVALALEIKQHLTREQWDNAFKFAFTRTPMFDPKTSFVPDTDQVIVTTPAIRLYFVMNRRCR